MTPFDITILAMVFFNLCLSVLIYIHGQRKKEELFYALISFFVSFWAMGTLLVSSSFAYKFPSLLYIAAPAHYVAGGLAYLAFFLFSLHYLDQKGIFHPAASVVSLIHVAVVGSVLVPSFFLETLRPEPLLQDRLSFAPLGYFIFVAYLTVIFTITEVMMVKKYFHSSGISRTRLGYIVIGTAIAGYLGILLNLVLPWFGNFSFFPAGPIFVTLFFTGASVYVLLKLNLFNIRVIATEIFVLFLVIILALQAGASQTTTEFMMGAAALLLALAFGLLLVRSVIKEVRVRERIARLAAELEKSNAELKSLDQAKSEFISIASHQLRTPLTSIKGYLSMMLEGDFGKLNLGLQEKLSRTYQMSQRLLRIVNDLLDLAKIEQKKLEYVFASMRLEELLKKIFDDFEGAAQNKGLKLDLNASKGLPPISADEEKLYHVFGNLVDNAIHYTQKGSITISVTVKETGLPQRVTVSVKDTGVGMTRYEIEELFTKYHRGADVSKIHTEGAGLGLYVAKQIVEDHGGRIYVESEGKGKGSIFFVELPIKRLE